MKKAVKVLAGLLPVCLMLTILVGIAAPKAVYAADKKEYSDPVVLEAATDPASVTAGNPFGVNITFGHPNNREDDMTLDGHVDKIEISVSCPNGSVQVSGAKYILNEGAILPPKTDEEGNTASVFQYTLHIPEKNLKYVGPGSATLRFTITYYSGEERIDGARFTVQKTVVYAAGSEENSILVDESSPIPTIEAGTEGTVNIPLVSNGMTGNVQISATLPADGGISFTTAGSVYTLTFADKQKQNLPMKLRIDSSVKEGIYPITLKAGGNDLTAYLRVTNAADGTGKLALESFKLDRSVVNEGQNFSLTLTIVNNSGDTYHNVVIALPSLDTASITANGTMDRKTLDVLEAGKTATVTFPLSANNSMASGNYPLEIQLSADELETPVSAAKVFVPVKGTSSEDGEGSAASKPQIIIERYDYGGMSVVGGQEFLLKMDFRNTSKSYSIENLKMTIGNPASEGETDMAAFTPAKSSNTFFIENVAPGAVFSQEIALYPKADAVPKSYGVTVKYTYEAVINGKRMTDLSGEETISIPLTQPDRFEIQDAEIYGPIMLGDSATLNLSYVNKGKSTVYNVSLTLEGENFTSGEMNSYIGNVESGTSDYFEATLNAEAEGMITGKAIITYEDANGQSKEVVKEFSCEVMPAYQPPVEQNPEEMPEPEAQGMPAWAVYTIAGVGVVVAVVSAVMITKLIKARKRRIEEEEEGYEEEVPPSGDDSV